jgi:hypothetical protein
MLSVSTARIGDKSEARLDLQYSTKKNTQNLFQNEAIVAKEMSTEDKDDGGDRWLEQSHEQA